MKCANAIISKQELSAQQIVSYLLGNGDNYTSHRFKEFYWKCYDLNVLHCFRGNAVSSERNVLDCSEHVGQDEARVLTNHAPDNYDNVDNPNDLLTDPLISCNDYVTVSVDQSGLLIPTAGCIADYIYRPECMQNMCLWDFLTYTDVMLHVRKMMSPAKDDGCDPDEEPAPTPPSVREPHRLPEVLTSFFTEDLYLWTYSTWHFQFSQCHPRRSTHGVRALRPNQKYTLVPFGAALPRGNNPASINAYSRVMLTFFKPWSLLHNLNPIGAPWTQCFNDFLQSDDFLYEHKQIMDNLQFLNDCRDSRDHESR